MGIKPVLALCGREKELPEVSHVSLTHRAQAGGEAVSTHQIQVELGGPVELREFA